MDTRTEPGVLLRTTEGQQGSDKLQAFLDTEACDLHLGAIRPVKCTPNRVCALPEIPGNVGPPQEDPGDTRLSPGRSNAGRAQG